MLMGKGVVWAEGEEHANMRRILAPAFTYVLFFPFPNSVSGYTSCAWSFITAEKLSLFTKHTVIDQYPDRSPRFS